MQPLIEQVEAINSLLSGADPSDLVKLADIHSRFETISTIADQSGTFSKDSLKGLTRQGDDARRKLEQLILNEAPDTVKHLELVKKAIDEIAGIINGVAPASEPQVAEEPEQASTATSPLNQVHQVVETAHIITEDDQPMVIEFVAEANSHLENAEQEILRLEEDPGNLDAIGALFRAFHTIKGVAGFLNLNQIQSLAHAAENLLDLGREGKVQITGAVSELILQSSDLMKKLVGSLDQAAQTGKPLEPMKGVKELSARLNEIAGQVSSGKYVQQAASVPAASAASESSASPETAKSSTTSSSDNSVKVATDRLDSLINMVGELVIANSMVAQDVGGHLSQNQRLSRHISHLGKIVRDLQDLSMSLRMVPVNSVFRKMTRLVRDVARKAGKEVELVITGAETELDRNVVDALGDPLVHMVRNSVDHGIEPADQRVAAGKSRVGRIQLNAYHKSGNINIEIIDDGRGLNKEKILEKAIKNGLVQETDVLTDQEIYRLVFAAGLSTAEKVTDISGRGVGMDVVKRNIEALRGRIDITTEKGKGSTFTIRLPLTLAVIDGLVVKVGQNKYILPITSIEQSIRPTSDNLTTVQGRAEILNIRGSLLPLVRLHKLFNVQPGTDDPTKALVVIVQDSDRRVCLLVDELLGQEQVVIKSLGEDMGRVQGISGCAVLGDGNVSLILDVPGIVEISMQ